MNNKIYLIRLHQPTGRLTGNWVPTGDPKRPLACVWSGTNASPAAAASPTKKTGTKTTRAETMGAEKTGTEETGRMARCA
jgi:hypothetical protein